MEKKMIRDPQTAIAEDAAKAIELEVAEAETHPDGSISSYRMFRGDLEALLEVRMHSREDDELSGLLKKFNIQLENGKLNVFKAGLVLRELATALTHVNRFYLMQAENNGLNDHEPLSPWEEEAHELARKVLVRAYKGFQDGSLKYYSAESLMWEAKPFIRHNSAEQLFLAELMRPILQESMRSYPFYVKAYTDLFKRLQR